MHCTSVIAGDHALCRMSHYFRLDALYGGFYVGLTGGVLNVACAGGHRDFAMRAKALGYDVIGR